MKVILPESKTYLPGAGACIYCWPKKITRDGLSREHIIPHKLGGRLILHQASCAACAEKINKEIETPTLTKTWMAARTHLKLPTGSPKLSLPLGKFDPLGEAFPSDLSNDAHNFRFEDVPIGEYPNIVLLPRFATPGILSDSPLTNAFTLHGIDAFSTDGTNLQPSGTLQQFDPAVVCRSIAKIAHGAAVAQLGFDAFTPLLPDVILGHDPNISHLVGSALHPRSKTSGLHSISLGLRCGYLVAYIRLFSRYGVRPYVAVVGKPNQTLSKWHLSARTTLSGGFG